MTGIDVVELCAELTAFGAGRKLDDNVQILLRYANGARGMLWASQVAPGHENGLSACASTARRAASTGCRRTPTI